MRADPAVRARVTSAEKERYRIQDFLLSNPDRHVHVLDAMYRLSSATSADPVRLTVWEDEDGRLVGFGAWLPAFKMFDYGFDERVGTRWIADAILDSAVDWFNESVRMDGAPRTCWVNVLSQNVEWRAAVETRGFTQCAWSLVHVESSLERQLDPPQLPAGFQLRGVRGVEEADAWAALHRAIFPKVGMTAAWRRTMVGSRTHRSDLDLVAVAPGGELVAFCQGWLGDPAAETVGQIEPFGTHPDHRRNGLGRAVLLELMRRMQQRAVRTIFVEPWDDNAAAVRAYASVGLVPTFRVPTYSRTFR
jgi:mycothiol synthase